MPRTIEGIVECHRVVRERRAAGLPPWDHRIDIKAVLTRDPGNETEEHAAAVANEIGALLRSGLPDAMLDVMSEAFDAELSEIVDHLEWLKPDSHEGIADRTNLEDLNDRLEEIYDWADGKRVWLG